MNRDERQELIIESWKAFNGKATVVAATGFGKTTVATKIIQRYIVKNPNAKILIVVPKIVLKKQWKKILKKLNIHSYCQVEVINTVIKKDWDCNLLIIDEAHRAASLQFRQVFTKVAYNRLLCLTATLERVDGLEYIIQHYAPVCSTVTTKECIENGWIADYQEYKILIEVDLTDYYVLNQEFLKHFSFFDYDLDSALKAVKQKPYQNLLAVKKKVNINVVRAHTYSFMRLLKARIKWVVEHPKKIEIANKILNAKKNEKILTFSSSLNQVKKLVNGEVIHYKVPEKKREAIIKKFSEDSSGVLHSIDTLKEGLDVQGVSVAILVGYDSSILKKIQTIGRAIRKEADKKSEIYTLVLKDTVEEQWFNKSSRMGEYLTIDEDDLNLLLNISSTQTKGLYFN